MKQVHNGGVGPRLHAALRDGDGIIASAGAVLRQFLTDTDRSLFTDAVVARVRGMVNDVARQLLLAETAVDEQTDPSERTHSQGNALSEALVSSTPFLAHVHGLALEWHLTERLEIRAGLDYVLSPLVQDLIASDDADLSASAMALLAAQARFVQQQRRMELPLGELPGDLFHGAVVTWRNCTAVTNDSTADAIERRLRSDFDESRSRLGLIARIATAMGPEAVSALDIRHGGVAMFLTALAFGAGQERHVCALATNARHVVRLALSLRAAGVKPQAVMNQIMFIHSELEPPQWLRDIDPESAATMLAVSVTGWHES
ncbi:MAG: hypothetical protein R3E21_08515 [Caenibius sp.]